MFLLYFNEVFSFGVHFFILNNIICIAFMSPTNTQCLCHLNNKNYIQEGTWLIINIFFLCRFKKVKIFIYIYIHIILAQKLFNLVICSGETESLETTSLNISSTLN